MIKPTISEFREFCKKNSTLTLGYAPYDCGSWRGIYAEPCIFVEKTAGTLGSFISYLDRLASGETFSGYKGGDYEYSEHSEINIELSEGNCSGDGSYLFDVLITMDSINDPIGVLDLFTAS